MRTFNICFTALLTVGLASATRLTFDIGDPGQIADNSSVVQNYGDRVTATSMIDGALTYQYGSEGGFTPNVVAQYGPASVTSDASVVGCPFNLTDTCIYLFGSDFGDLTNVIAQAADIGTVGYGRIVVTLTADAGFVVDLSSFDLAGWPQSDKTVASITVRDVINNVVLASASNQLIVGNGGHTTFSGSLSARVLEITIDASNLTGNDGQNVGLDNIVFGQLVETPEPSTWALMGGALSTLALRARRRA